MTPKHRNIDPTRPRRRALLACVLFALCARSNIAAAGTTFSFAIENKSSHSWTPGVLAVLPATATPNALLQTGPAPTAGDHYASYNYAHLTCDDVVNDGDAAGLIANFTGLVAGANAIIVPALAPGDATIVSIQASPGEVASFIARVANTDDDVVMMHAVGNDADNTIDLFDSTGLPLPSVPFDIAGYDVAGRGNSSGKSEDCRQTCPPPPSNCYVARGASSVGFEAGGDQSSATPHDFSTALWTRVETAANGAGFTTDTIASGNVSSATAGDELVVLMQGGQWYGVPPAPSTGRVSVLATATGSTLHSFSPSAGRDIMGPVTIVDLDGAAPAEYLIGEALPSDQMGALMALRGTSASPADSLWIETPRGFPGFWNLGPSVADVLGGPGDEIISPSLEGLLQVLNLNGAPLDQIDLFSTYGERLYGTVAVGDIDRDGQNELAVVGGTLGQVIVLRPDGNLGDGTMSQLFVSNVNSSVAFGSGPALANIDDDPALEVIVTLTGDRGNPDVVRAYDMVNGPGTDCEYQWNIAGVDGFRWTSPVAGDIDNDGRNEIVVQGNDGTLSVLSTKGLTGGSASCAEGTIDGQISVGGAASWFTPALSDLVGGPGVDIVAAGFESLVVVQMFNGQLAVTYRATDASATFYSSAVITPGSGVIGESAGRITTTGWINSTIYQFGTAPTDHVPVPWKTFMGNNQRTGTATPP